MLKELINKYNSDMNMNKLLDWVKTAKHLYRRGTGA